MQVTIREGSYRNTEVHNQIFELVSRVKTGAGGSFITVRPNAEIGAGRDKIRIKVHADNVEYDELPAVHESDEQIIARITERFDILEEMTTAAIEANIRAMIVTGPPGVGKSFGVEKQLQKASLLELVADKPPKYEVLKGSISAIGLYVKLYNNSGKNNVVVFDDCDSVFQDEDSLNILKSALDSNKKRRICWNKDSSWLRQEGIPNEFDFCGSVIFITNLKFDSGRSKAMDAHMAALQSRCHYLDLTMNTIREIMLRIQDIHNTGELFVDYKFKGNEGDQVVEFMLANKDRLREVSLRMALKIADLIKISETRWERLAESTVMKTSF